MKLKNPVTNGLTPSHTPAQNFLIGSPIAHSAFVPSVIAPANQAKNERIASRAAVQAETMNCGIFRAHAPMTAAPSASRPPSQLKNCMIGLRNAIAIATTAATARTVQPMGPEKNASKPGSRVPLSQAASPSRAPLINAIAGTMAPAHPAMMAPIFRLPSIIIALPMPVITEAIGPAAMANAASAKVAV